MEHRFISHSVLFSFFKTGNFDCVFFLIQKTTKEIGLSESIKSWILIITINRKTRGAEIRGSGSFSPFQKLYIYVLPDEIESTEFTYVMEIIRIGKMLYE